ncbi:MULTISPECIES: hypothetical protein [unclassified Pseudoalteromonas]|uniref:hypothetical protein n=1 Tax=unclassified Pseudoalteromonas TaxID=194690 RepID=UPI0015FF5D78|nr:hypothetical protein [Pseudoalteromonas sp. SR44-8]MBB1301500.1 hypothetical protein [Pseudoalteromonas sp. SR44-8]
MLNISLKLFLVGLLLNPFLINLIGFINPFWAALVLEEPEKSRDILHAFQPYVPFVSIIYVAALFYLAKIEKRIWLKVVCVICSTLYIGSSIYGLLPDEGVLYTITTTIYFSMETSLLFIAGLILIRQSSASQSGEIVV